MTQRRKIIATILLPLLVVAGTGIYYGFSPTPLPDLLEGIQPDGPSRPFADASQQFTERLAGRFLPGTLQADLEQELSREGFFHPASVLDQVENGHTAAFIRKGGLRSICRRDATVNWISADNVHVDDIAGSYTVTCP